MPKIVKVIIEMVIIALLFWFFASSLWSLLEFLSLY